MLDWLSDNTNLVLVLVIAGILVRIQMARQSDMLPAFQVVMPGAFAWAAFTAAKNSGGQLPNSDGFSLRCSSDALV
jgi:hypothetical protein